MRERPILFSAPMVRAILAGTKTQTRRVVKIPGIMSRTAFAITSPEEEMIQLDDGTFHYLSTAALSGPYACPYGQPGDRLWVKETWRTAKSLDAKSPASIGEMCIDAGYRKPWAPLAYEADGHRNSEWRGFEIEGNAEPGKTRVSIHMPRWASRITLEITGVRVERLQDISEADAISEGITTIWPDGPRADGGPNHYTIKVDYCSYNAPTATGVYAMLWDVINGPGSWAANPWVWVVEFRRVDRAATV